MDCGATNVTTNSTSRRSPVEVAEKLFTSRHDVLGSLSTNEIIFAVLHQRRTRICHSTVWKHVLLRMWVCLCTTLLKPQKLYRLSRVSSYLDTCMYVAKRLHDVFTQVTQKSSIIINECYNIKQNLVHPTFTPPNECQNGGVMDPSNNGYVFVLF